MRQYRARIGLCLGGPLDGLVHCLSYYDDRARYLGAAYNFIKVQDDEGTHQLWVADSLGGEFIDHLATAKVHGTYSSGRVHPWPRSVM